MPKCHLKPGEDQETASIRYLYEIANVLPGFLEERGFTVESAYGVKKSTSPLLNEDVKMYYRDYICGTSGKGISHYISQFMITVPVLSWKCSCVPRKWMTLRKLVRQITWDMRRNSRMSEQDAYAIPEGECVYFDEAYERGIRLLQLELADLDVNMFSAVDNSLINDGCGLFRED